MQKLTREEWETHISIDDLQGFAVIDSSIPKDINRCRKQGYEVLKENFYDDGSICNVIFKAPREVISFRNLNKLGISDTLREERRKRAILAFSSNTRTNEKNI